MKERLKVGILEKENIDMEKAFAWSLRSKSPAV